MPVEDCNMYNYQASLKLALILVAASSLTRGEPAAPCTEKDQLIPDTEDCTIFYECTYGKPVKFTCPEGLVYFPDLLRCDYPTEGGCQPGQKPGSDNSHKVPECPEVIGDQVIHIANPDDCTTFYKCNNEGEAILISCPPGLHFNDKEKVCDYPEHANCQQ